MVAVKAPSDPMSKAVQRPGGQAEISRTPLSALDTFITPTALHYVRDHLTETPDLDPERWCLRVEGEVRSTRSLSLAELEQLPMVDLTVTMECAGNGGANSVVGVGCISTAEWRGPRLRDVLDLAGLTPEAREVVLTGADSGTDPDDPAATGAYARSLPIEKALDPDTLLALFMNGDRLPRQHGYPARVLVPAWYGMDSIKWLCSIRATREPFAGFYMAHRYRETRGPEGLDVGRQIREMVVKSLIAHPTLDERVRLGEPYRIVGAAWAGPNRIAEVRVSVDDGAGWAPAQLLGEHRRYAWRQWEYSWTPERLGGYTVMARAWDSRGRAQPLERVPGRIYEAHWVHRVPVQVVGPET